MDFSFWQEQLNLFAERLRTSGELFYFQIRESFSLWSVVDILLVAVFLWFLWSKFKSSRLIRALLRLALAVVIAFIAKVLGLVTLFYLSAVLGLWFLIGIPLLYSDEIKTLLEGWSRVPAVAEKKLSPPHIKNLVKGLSDALAALSRAQVASLFVVRWGKPLRRLVEAGTSLNTPVEAAFLVDLFSHPGRLSRGAVIIEGDRVVAAGSSLGLGDASRIVINVQNPLFKQIASDYEAIVLLTDRSSGQIGLIFGPDTYQKLTPAGVVRVLTNILTS